jgi:hypothetical protein
MLQYDKLYQSLKKVSGDWHAGHLQWGYCWYYLKFFADGTVMRAYLDGDNATLINNWLVKGAENIATGTYISKGLNFEISYPTYVAKGTFTRSNSFLLFANDYWDEYTLIE